MNGAFVSLVSFALASALVPAQVVVTLLLLGAPAGRRTALAWVVGMTAARLVQGVLFGFIFSSADTGRSTGTGPVVSTVFLVMALTMLVAALRTALSGTDPDAPPPKWLELVQRITPGRALLIGAGYIAISLKLWIFTLGVIAAIHQAKMGLLRSTLAFLGFVAGAEVLHLLILGTAYTAGERSAARLTRATGWLRTHNDQLVVVLGLIFGVWFLIKALSGYGIL